mmetsp:Transcript_3895/g.11720  ORF Transcript_3895/g.11720 Transcript_3895/m.11720 type:complete len:209 (+) Transcript_3895:734-1360(+)
MWSLVATSPRGDPRLGPHSKTEATQWCTSCTCETSASQTSPCPRPTAASTRLSSWRARLGTRTFGGWPPRALRTCKCCPAMISGPCRSGLRINGSNKFRRASPPIPCCRRRPRWRWPTSTDLIGVTIQCCMTSLKAPMLRTQTAPRGFWSTGRWSTLYTQRAFASCWMSSTITHSPAARQGPRACWTSACQAITTAGPRAALTSSRPA